MLEKTCEDSMFKDPRLSRYFTPKAFARMIKNYGRMMSHNDIELRRELIKMVVSAYDTNIGKELSFKDLDSILIVSLETYSEERYSIEKERYYRLRKRLLQTEDFLRDTLQRYAKTLEKKGIIISD